MIKIFGIRTPTKAFPETFKSDIQTVRPGLSSVKQGIVIMNDNCAKGERSKYKSFQILAYQEDTESMQVYQRGSSEEQAFLTLNKWIPIKTAHQSFVVIDNPTYPYKGKYQDGLSF